MLRHSSVPEFGNAFDAVSYAVHAVWRVLGARLIALSEDAEASTSLAQDSSLPDAWNSSRDLYCFVYRIPGLDVPVVVKLVRMASALHVHAAKKDSNTIFSVELRYARLSPILLLCHLLYSISLSRVCVCVSFSAKQCE